ncbi:hypothetical protein KUTeg_017051 [Tegillarca granosa]|uniref:General transcription factor 3C polypeptide 3 n=1 Tax=Tegillarca granosa TaxID=220873 RepID=A0ABQ9ERG7_TEGGR|nr:hypothetical protein KUTeg_017051 [Tegillarca granosa]
MVCIDKNGDDENGIDDDDDDDDDYDDGDNDDEISDTPRAILPFQTLGMLYETIGDMKKSMQFYLIAAYLDPSDAEEWVRLAELSLEQNDVNQAIKCYTHAIQADRTNVQYLWERCKLYEEIGDKNKVMEGYEAILKVLPPEEGEQYFELARLLTKWYHELDDKVSATKTMKNAFLLHADQVSAEDVNFLLELQISQKQYLQALEILVMHCGLWFMFNDGSKWTNEDPVDLKKLEDKEVTITKCAFPDMIPIDLRVKLAVCLIYQNLHDIVKAVIEPLFEENIEEMGDLYLDVAEAYMENKYYHDAKPILQQLVCSAHYNLVMWLKFAECLNSLGEFDHAVQAFSRVVELAPAHVGARMSLSTLQQKLGKHEEAIQALSREDVDRTTSLSKQYLLLHGVFVILVAGRSELPVDDLWDIFVKLCDLLLEENRMDDLMEVTTLGMNCPYFFNDIRKMKEENNNQVWNLFNQVLLMSSEKKHNRFCLRYLLSVSIDQDLDLH